jgi:predicted lipid-binding transport protein (Tim44 family)
MARRQAVRAALTAAALGATGSAMGRIGGGNHSALTVNSGSEHSGGSSGGGVGSLGGIIALVVIALIVRYIYRRIARGAPQVPAALAALSAGLGADHGASPPPSSTLQTTIDSIRAGDPGFEMETFLQRAEMTFFLVKRGLQQNNAAAVRPYLDDATFAEVSRSIGLSKTQHRHELLESLNVRALHLQSAELIDQNQRLQIHFDLVYRAKTLSDTNQELSDENEDRPHGERWMFTRNAAARTPVAGGVTASRCPACGAELRLNLDGTCAHCRASVTNGAVDWVVADVRSAPFMGYAADSSAGVAAATVADGIASLRAADPGFALDGFQVRVKAAFLALQDAWCRQNLDAGRAFLSPGAYFTWRAQIETLAAEGRRNMMENISVRSIEPVQVVHGRVFDDLTVRISAAAADFETDKDAKVVFGDRTVKPFTEDWTFQRSVGVATVQKPGTLENTCPSCGAPVSLNQIGECRFCKAAVTSGKFDWVVSRIEQDDVNGRGDSILGNVGADLAMQVGGAVVGSLIGSLLSGRGSGDSRK